MLLYLFILLCFTNYASYSNKLFLKSNKNKTFLKLNNKLKQQQDNDAAGTSTQNTDLPNAGNNLSVTKDTEKEPKEDNDLKVNEEKSAFCFINDDGIVFDLNSLENTNEDYTVNTGKGIVNFNFCKNTVNKCDNSSSGMAFYNSQNSESELIEKKCFKMAGEYAFSSRYGIEYSNEERTAATIKMVMPLGDQCEVDNSVKYRTMFIIKCDPEAVTPHIESNVFTELKCENTVNIRSKAACPLFNVFSVYNTIKANKYIFGSLIILLGIFVCFVGIKFVLITQMIAGGLAVTLVFIWIIFTNVKIEYNTGAFWGTIAGCAVAGAITMYLLNRFESIGRALLGALLGLVGGMFLYNVAMRYIESNPAIVFWVLLSICIVSGAIAGVILGKPAIVISSSVIGAYGIVRGISFMAGGFPDEGQVYSLGQKGEWDQMKELLTAVVYGYLAAFLILSAVGMIVQFRYFYNDEEENQKEKENNNVEKEVLNPKY